MRSYNFSQSLQNDENRSLMGSSRDFLDSAGDFAYNIGTYSAGAATSVVSSVGNLAVHAGNFFTDNEFEEFDTGEMLGSAYDHFGFDSDRAMEFYDNHAAAVELGGLVAGSMIPGGLAVRGFRALQMTGKVTKGVRQATGLKNPNMHQFRVNKLVEKIKQDKFSVHKNARRELYKQGFTQNAMEAAVYEFATFATLNRNPVLSQDEYGYFETFGKNWKEIGFGVALGGGLGGSLSAISTHGALRKATAAADTQINQFATVNTPNGMKTMFAGDSVAGKLDNWTYHLAQKMNLAEQELRGVATQAEGKSRAATNAMESLRVELISDLNKTIKQRPDGTKENLGQFFVDNILNRINQTYRTRGGQAATDEAKKAMDSLSGIDGIGHIDPVDIQSRFLQRNVQVFDDADSAVMETVKKSIPKGKFGGTDEFSFLEQNYLNSVNPEVAEASFIRAASITDAAELRTKFHNYNRLREQGVNPKNPFIGKVNNQLEGLQRSLSNRFRVVEDYISDVNNAVVDPVRFGRAEEIMSQLKDPEIMFKNAFQWLEDAKTARKAQEIAPDLAKMFTKNNLLRRRFGESVQYLNPYSGRIEDSVSAPTLRDFGFVNDKKIASGQLTAGPVKVDLKQKPLQLGGDDFPDAIQISGHYFASVKHPKSYLKNRGLDRMDSVIDGDDLPALYAKKKLGEKMRIEVTDTQGSRIIDIDPKTAEGAAAYQEFMRERKRTIALSLRNGNVEARKISAQDAITDPKKIQNIQEPLTEQEIARIIDTDVDALTKDLLKVQQTQSDRPSSLFFSEQFDPANPSRIQLRYSKPYMQDYMKEGAADFTERNMIYQEKVTEQMEDLVRDLSLGKDVRFIPNSIRAKDNFAYRATGGDSVAGMVTSSNPDLFSTAAYTQAIGKQSEHLGVIQAEHVVSSIQTPTRNLKAAGKEAVAEASAILQSVTRNRKYYPGKQVSTSAQALKDNVSDMFQSGNLEEDTFNTVFEFLVRAENSSLVSSDIQRAIIRGDVDEISRFASMSEDAIRNQLITPESQAVRDFLDAGYDLQNRYSRISNEVANATGHRNTFDPDLFYPGKFNTQRYSHMAFVEDVAQDATWGARRKGVVVANNSEQLQDKIAQVQANFGDKVKITTNKQVSDFKKAVQEYDADLAMGENFIDSAMANKGITWDFMPEVAENVIDDYVSSLQSMARESVRDVTRGYYAQEIETLRRLHENTTYADSAISLAKRAQDKSVYKENLNQMLNISNRDKYEWYYSVQEKLDDIISSGYYSVRSLVNAGFSAKDEAKQLQNFEAMKGAMDRFGLPQIYKDLDNYVQANTDAPKRVMQSIVAASQGILSTLTLRMDHAQAAVNAMSTPILLNSAVKEAITSFGVKADDLASIRRAAGITDAAGNVEFSNAPFMHQAIKRMFTKPELLKQYEEAGYVSTLLRDVKNAVDQAALKDNFMDKVIVGRHRGGTAAAEKAARKEMSNMRKTWELVSGITANDFSEQFVKFISTDVAHQIGRQMKLPEREIRTMAWNFMTKVNGNYTASQRPVLFQGWMGQSLGLFQTYSFNIMQTAFRNLRDRDYGAFRSMLGAQTTIFGAQSLPGFQAMNDFIAKRTFGEQDFYSFADEMGGENDWAAPLVYGWASAATIPIFGEGIDFFNRGDLTPRTPIMIPTQVSDIPLYSFTADFLRNIGETGSKIANGAPVGEALMQGLARNGLNRPLAGMSQLAVGNRVTGQGSMLYDYHDIDGWTLAAKFMGTRSMNEAVETNAFYRARENQSARQQSLSSLGRAVKDSVRAADGSLNADQIRNVMGKYEKQGGRMDTFNQWMGNVYQSATESEINTMRNAINNPESRYLYNMLDPIPDFTNREQLGR